MGNFPASHEPKKWSEVKYQSNVVRRIQKWIISNDYPTQVFVSGSSGVGKTASIRLMLRSALCLNRSKTEVDPCSKCAACKHDPVVGEEIGNVVWVQAESTEGSTYQAAIKEALTLVDRGPRGNGDETLFVIFNECHLMPKDLMQRALAKADVLDPRQGKVCMIFMTMSPDSIKPDIAKQALIDRGEHLIFNRPTEQQIQDYLLEKFDISAIAAKLIASTSNRSIRGALSQYRNCSDRGFVTQDIVSDCLRLTRPSARTKLWRMLAEGQRPSDIRTYIEILLQYAEPLSLMELLYQDIQDNEDTLTDDFYLSISQLFFEYFRNPISFNCSYVLLNLRRYKLKIEVKGREEENEYTQLIKSPARYSVFDSGYSATDTLASSGFTVEVVNRSDNN